MVHALPAPMQGSNTGPGCVLGSWLLAWDSGGGLLTGLWAALPAGVDACVAGGCAARLGRCPALLAALHTAPGHDADISLTAGCTGLHQLGADPEKAMRGAGACMQLVLACTQLGLSSAPHPQPDASAGLVLAAMSMALPHPPPQPPALPHKHTHTHTAIQPYFTPYPHPARYAPRRRRCRQTSSFPRK